MNSLEQGRTSNWILITSMLAPANSAWFADFAGFAVKWKFRRIGWAVEWWTCACRNCREIHPSTQGMFCDFSRLKQLLQETLKTQRKLRETFLAYFVCSRCFLDFDPRWIFDAFTETSSPARVFVRIPMVNYRTVHQEKLCSWPPVSLVQASENVLSPENLCVSPDFVWGNIEIRRKQNSLFPKGTSH